MHQKVTELINQTKRLKEVRSFEMSIVLGNLNKMLKEGNNRKQGLILFYLAAITAVLIYRPDTIQFFIVGLAVLIPLEFIFQRRIVRKKYKILTIGF